MLNVREFGAEGNGKTDDTSAFQKAFDALNKPVGRYGWSPSGGTVFIPPGCYRVSSAVNIVGDNIRIQGESGPCNTGRNTWIKFTGTGALFHFPRDEFHTGAGFSASGFVIVGVKRDPKDPTVAFDIQTGIRFRRDLLFYRIGVFHFQRAIGVWRDDKVKPQDQWQIGKLTIERCSMKWNTQVLDFGHSTSCNHLRIVGNDATLNKGRQPDEPPVSIFNIRAFGVTLHGNLLEGQENAIRFRKSEDVDIRGNFFEANTGYAILVEKSKRICIGMNRYYGQPVGCYHVRKCTNVLLDEPEERMLLENNVGIRWAR